MAAGSVTGHSGSVRRGIFYGWIVTAVTFVTLLISSGVRSSPGVFIHPVEMELHWSRAEISVAVSIGLLLYGLAGPFAGRLMDRFGPRRIMLVGLLLIAVSTAASAWLTSLWQLVLFWGVFSGVGTGVAAAVLGATVATRWFVTRRGLVLGIFGAGSSAGQLIFLPLLMTLVTTIGWRASSVLLGIAALAAILPVLIWMRDDPADVQAVPYGAPPPAPLASAVDPLGVHPGAVQVSVEASGVTPGGASLAGASLAGASLAGASLAGGVMSRALRVPEFWLLAGSFFVCGATSNGLIGTHLIPHSIDHGIPEVTAASAVALMGAMNFLGTLFSGWLTDRYDPRKLLACYYIFRGGSLFLLPFVTDFSGLAVFAIVFGLDYIATVPPTSALVADIFGRRNVGTVFGWVFFSHQAGAALAAYLGGLARTALGDYRSAFLTAGVLAVLGGVMALCVNRPRPAQLRPALA